MGGWFGDSSQGDESETYGRHSYAHGRISVAALLRQVVASGGAIRLVWRHDDSDASVDQDPPFPTAELPIVRDELDVTAKEEDTEPTTATREARKWLQRPSFAWWLRLLVE